MEFQLSYFKSEKTILLKCCIQYGSKFGKLSSGHRTGKGQFSFQFTEGQWQRLLNYHTIALISHASKVMFKILQARLQQYRTEKSQMFNLDLEEAEEPEIKLPTSVGSSKKQVSSRKTSTSALLTMPSLWLRGSPQTVENSSSDRNTRPPDLPPEKSVCRSGSNS